MHIYWICNTKAESDLYYCITKSLKPAFSTTNYPFEFVCCVVNLQSLFCSRKIGIKTFSYTDYRSIVCLVFFTIKKDDVICNLYTWPEHLPRFSIKGYSCGKISQACTYNFFLHIHMMRILTMHYTTSILTLCQILLSASAVLENCAMFHQ